MREPRPIAGARAPLFDRLADRERAVPREPAPFRVLGREALIASVRAELSRLFNTRRTTPARPLGIDYGAIDYGVPDFGGRSAASATDREQYAEALARALQRYEPRLIQIRIELTQIPNEPLRLTGTLRARLEMGTVREPVSFPLALQDGGELRLGVAAAEAASGAAAGAAAGATE